ncbi:MAG TPA: hypothetical protein VFB76_06460 [Candidatus Angelobacter sp.]|nr:hypothetical protein [Candidatus Angelobacter sp.]
MHRTIFKSGQWLLISSNNWRWLLLLVLLLAGAADMRSLNADFDDDDGGTPPVVVTLQSEAKAEMPCRKCQLQSTSVMSSTNAAGSDLTITLFPSNTQSIYRGDPAPLIAPLRC